MVPLATSASVITPIVFCASLVPCARASIPPDRIWPSRKPRVGAAPGRSLPDDPVDQRIATPATAKARIGATTAGISTFPSKPVAE